MANKCLAVIGAQYGSEGKGVIVHHLAHDFQVHVRVGGPNAGHTFFDGGKYFKMRSLPCGWVNPDAALVIGAGAIIDPQVLMHEISLIEDAGYSVRERLFIDPAAWCIVEEDRDTERRERMDDEIGSTLEGIGSARAHRIRRSPVCDHRFQNVASGLGLQGCVKDTAAFLSGYLGLGDVLLEGTQGSGLSLIHGKWPYVTSADTNAAQLAADCGLAPSVITDVMLVMRTFPIRVGGNSGPLAKETTWGELSRNLGRTVEEYTTVTGRRRRVGEWDPALIMRAQLLNRAQWAALTFADYLDPDVFGRTALTPKVEAFVHALEQTFGFQVALVGTGGSKFTVVDRRAQHVEA